MRFSVAWARGLGKGYFWIPGNQVQKTDKLPRVFPDVRKVVVVQRYTVAIEYPRIRLCLNSPVCPKSLMLAQKVQRRALISGSPGQFGISPQLAYSVKRFEVSNDRMRMMRYRSELQSLTNENNDQPQNVDVNEPLSRPI